MDPLVKYFMQHYGDSADEAQARARHLREHPDAADARSAFADLADEAKAQRSGGTPGLGSVPRAIDQRAPADRAAGRVQEMAADGERYARAQDHTRAQLNDYLAHRGVRHHQAVQGVHGHDPLAPQIPGDRSRVAQYQRAQMEQQMMMLHTGLVQKGLDPQLAAQVTAKLMTPQLTAPPNYEQRAYDRMQERNTPGPSATSSADLVATNPEHAISGINLDNNSLYYDDRPASGVNLDNGAVTYGDR